MDSEKVLTFAAIGVGIYAVYKIFSNPGVEKTTDAIGDVAQSVGGLATNVIKTTDTVFKETSKIGETIYKDVKSGEIVASGNPFVQGNKVIVDAATNIAQNLFAKPTTTTSNYTGVQQISGLGENWRTPTITTITPSNLPPVSSGLYSTGIQTVKTVSSVAPSSSTMATVKTLSTPTTVLKTSGSFSGATVRTTTTPIYKKPY
jgi:hypothetical protein